MELTADKSAKGIIAELFFAILVVLGVAYLIELAVSGTVTRYIQFNILISWTVGFGLILLTAESNVSEKRMKFAEVAIFMLCACSILLQSSVSLLLRLIFCVALLIIVISLINGVNRKPHDAII